MSLSLFSSRRLLLALLLGCLSILFLPPRSARAQSPTLAWAAAYNGTSSIGSPVAMKVDAQGNAYVTGVSSAFGVHFVIVKYDPNGNQLWSVQYNAPADLYDTPVAMSIDTQGSVYVTGTSVEASGTKDFLTVKYDTNGNQLWAARYNGRFYTGATNDTVKALGVDAQGNVYVTGASYDIHGNFFSTTIKYDTNGNQLWFATYGGSASAIAVDAQNNVYVTGDNTVKYDTNGRRQWAVTNTRGSTAMTVDTKGSVYITGNGYATVKYDTNGNKLWSANYNGTGNGGTANAIAVNAQGNVYVTGASDGRQPVTYFNAGDSSSDYATVKYDTNGIQLWAARYNGPGDDYDQAYALALDAQGNVYVTGGSAAQATTSFGNYGSNNSIQYATVKYDVNGQQSWVARYGSGAGVAVAVDALGGVYVTGSVATLKYVSASPDITSQVSITRSGFRYVRATGSYTQTITIRNVGSSAFSGPIALVLDGLGSGVTLSNRAGLTTTLAPLNSPYLSSTLTNVGNGDGMFDPGESVTFTLTFADPSGSFITYTPRILAGVAAP